MDDKTRCDIIPLPYIYGEFRSYSGVEQPFKAHSHDYFVVGLMKKGKRTLRCNDENFVVSEGDILVFNSGDVHACENRGVRNLEYDSVTFSKKFTGDIRLKGPVRRSNRISKLFRETVEAIRESDDEKALDAITEIIEKLESEVAKQEDPEHEKGDHPYKECVLDAMAYMRCHLAEPLNLSMLAKREGISVFSLIRAYKRHFLITPAQHFLSLRVECACELLAQGMKPSDVASCVGFSDQAHLTRVFKQRLATTPALYGKMIRAGKETK